VFPVSVGGIAIIPAAGERQLSGERLIVGKRANAKLTSADVCVNIDHHFDAAAFFRIKIAIFERSKKT
jgi:hypothetical protein